MTLPAAGLAPAELKACCAAVYDLPWAELLLGGFVHPGGETATVRLGQRLALPPGSRVLDIGAGPGRSAELLRRRFGWGVMGLDLGTCNARRQAERGLWSVVGDAEALPFAPATLDGVVLECTFCLFPSKGLAAAEMARVLAPGGRVGLSDVTLEGPLPPPLEAVEAYVACLQTAEPGRGYRRRLEEAGLRIHHEEDLGWAVQGFLDELREKLLWLRVWAGMSGVGLPALDPPAALEALRAARGLLEEGRLGYTLLVAEKP